MKSKWTYMALGAVAALVLAAGAFALVPGARAAGPPAAPYAQGMYGMHQSMLQIEGKVHAAVAARLGMSDAELDKALADGKSMYDLAREKNVDAATLRQTMLDAMNGAIDDLVKADKIDAASAEQWKGFMAQRAGWCLTGSGPQGRGPGYGMMGGRRFGRGNPPGR